MLLAQLLINGIAAGAIYSLVAIGFALIFNTTRMFHVAHGATYTAGAYAFCVAVIWLGLPYVLAAPIALLVATLIGIATNVVVYRPIKRFGGGENSILVASLGIIILLQSLYAMAFTTDTMTVRQGALPSFEVAGLSITVLHVIMLATVCLVFPALHAFLVWNRYGRAIRALADDPNLARAHGLDIRMLETIIFALGSALAGLAGILISIEIGVNPEMGFMAVFVATVAVIVGGVGQLYGTLLASFAIGLLQQLSVWKIDSAWQHAVVYALLVLFLILRPSGLFGHRLQVRQA